MGAFYPAGDEQVIVYEVTGRVVPEGGIPLNVGVVVSDVETALNVLAAVRHQAPVIEKYVTLTGAVRTPKTVKVPLGITVAEALALAGGPTVEHYEVINGGPMMGRVVSTGSAITKTTKGLIVVPRAIPPPESLESGLGGRMLQDARVACMQCSLCSEVCPRGLLGHRIQPHKMMRLAAYGALCDPEYTPMNAFLCCGCRLCEYACVMGLQPWKLNGMLKGEMGKKGVRNALHNQPEAAAPFRQYKRYPVHKLIHQLGLDGYDVPAPMEDSSCDYQMVTLPLSQGVGAPAQPVVRAGDRVERSPDGGGPRGKAGGKPSREHRGHGDRSDRERDYHPTIKIGRNWIMISWLLIAAFGGGIIGAYAGALPAFIMTGILRPGGRSPDGCGVGGDVAVNYLFWFLCRPPSPLLGVTPPAMRAARASWPPAPTSCPPSTAWVSPTCSWWAASSACWAS